MLARPTWRKRHWLSRYQPPASSKPCLVKRVICREVIVCLVAWSIPIPIIIVVVPNGDTVVKHGFEGVTCFRWQRSIKKTICRSHIIKVTFNLQPWLKVKRNFNYVRTANCFLNGTLPTEASNTLETMFDNGVTVWDDNDNNWDRYRTRDQTNNYFSTDNPFD